MNRNCTYTTVMPKSESGSKVVPIINRGVLIGFSDWPENNLMGIIATEEGEIILIDRTDIRVV